MKDRQTLLLVRNLATAARTTLIESSDDLWALSEAGQVFEAALRRLDVSGDGREMPERAFPTRGPLWLLGIGWHSPVDLLAALARLDGAFPFGPSLTPANLRTPLLQAFVEVSEGLGNSWLEGSEELSRRKGWIWRLRDMGLWEMPKSPNTKHITCC